MSPRDRRALILGGLVLGAAVMALRVLPAGLRQTLAARGALRERAVLLGRTRAEIAVVPELRDSAAVLSQALVALASQVLSGSTSAEAAADLSGRLNLAASRAPARVERISPLPDSSSEGRLGRVRVQMVLETDVRGLVAVLRSIGAAEEVLKLEVLRVEAPQPIAMVRGPEILKVELTVSGWYIKPRSAAKRTA